MHESNLDKFKRRKFKNDIKRLYLKIELGRHLVVECHVYS